MSLDLLKKEWKTLFTVIAIFLVLFYLPIGTQRFDNAILEALHLAKWYAQEHVLLCLIPAFFIAGAIAIFVSQNSVMKYLGAKANKVLAYGVASVSGSILAVCSCTVLPLFAGIYKMGAGLGPACAFLYSGPAINVLAIILTARILGLEIGIARAVGAILFSIVIGLLMHFIFRNEAHNGNMQMIEEEVRPLWQSGLFFFTLVAILVFANWSNPPSNTGWFYSVYQIKWALTSFFGILLSVLLALFFNINKLQLTIAILITALTGIFSNNPLLTFTVGVVCLSVVSSNDKGEGGEWFYASWGFAKQILPLLFIGVLVAGFLLGRPSTEGFIPSEYITMFVGDNSLLSNLFASVVGAFMYFATLTEIPIIQGLVGNGMAKGPALALLLAGPALSLPNMLVIRSVMGNKKTLVFVSLVIVMATITGMLFGNLF